MDFESLIGIYCKFFLLQFRDLYSETPFIDNVFLRTRGKKTGGILINFLKKVMKLLRYMFFLKIQVILQC